MSELSRSTLGRTGLEVTNLGYGAMELRGGRGPMARPMEPAAAESLLNQVLDAGINFIDTSPDYGGSEELIGECIAHRRSEFVLASKCGCPVNQPPAPAGQRNPHVFTRENIRAGVEQSLRRMKTDRLDLVQFHISPSRAELEQNDSLDELYDLQRQGKIRFIGMSGTLPNLVDHIDMGVFDEFQIPYSALERDHEPWLSRAAEAGAGVVVRGGVAKGFPVARSERIARLPGRFRDMARQRLDLYDLAGLDEILDGMPRMEFMLRFTISHPHMSTTIVGTGNPGHLADNVQAALKGPLPPELYERAKQRLERAAGSLMP